MVDYALREVHLGLAFRLGITPAAQANLRVSFSGDMPPVTGHPMANSDYASSKLAPSAGSSPGELNPCSGNGRHNS